MSKIKSSLFLLASAPAPRVQLLLPFEGFFLQTFHEQSILVSELFQKSFGLFVVLAVLFHFFPGQHTVTNGVHEGLVPELLHLDVVLFKALDDVRQVLMLAPSHQVVVAKEEAIPRHNESINRLDQLWPALHRQFELFDVELIGEPGEMRLQFR